MFLQRASSHFMMAAPTMSRRLFSIAAIPTVPLQYTVDMARVKVCLPQHGNCWFFINPNDTVSNFVEAVCNEDSKVKSLEILSGPDSAPKAVKKTLPLYKVLNDRDTPVYLRLNNMLYQFANARVGEDKVDLTEQSQWFNQCKQAGLANMHSTTIATILRQVENNIDFAEVEEASAPEAKPDAGKNGTKKTAAKKAAVTGPTVELGQVCDTFMDQC